MRVRTRTALGIDIGERRLSVALVEKGEQGLRIVAAARGDLPTPEPGESGLGRVLSGLLGQLGRRGRLCRTRAAVAVSGNPLVMQLLDLPQPVPTNLGEFVTHELQQYVALSGRTLVSDFCGVGSGVQKRLLAAAADADEMETIVKTCRAAGIVVDAVEPSMLAYARAVLGDGKGVRSLLPERPGGCFAQKGCDPLSAPGGDVLIAMLGARTLTTGLFRRGTLDFVRTRSLPVDVHTPRLLCLWLADELRVVVRYYETQVSQTAGAWRICVAVHDGAHRADEIAPWLAAEAPTRSFSVVDVCEPSTAPGSLPEVSLAAVGAALTLLGTGANGLKINLLPRAVTEARARARYLLLTANVGMLVFLGIFVTSQFLTRTTGAMAYRIQQTRLDGELYTMPALVAEEKFVDQEIARFRERVDPLRQAMEGRQVVDWPGILQAVRQAAPAEVSVTQLYGGDGRAVSVKGLAPSCPAAEAFVRNLEGQGPFASVSLATLEKRRDADDRLEYRIDCLLKSNGGAS